MLLKSVVALEGWKLTVFPGVSVDVDNVSVFVLLIVQVMQVMFTLKIELIF